MFVAEKLLLLLVISLTVEVSFDLRLTKRLGKQSRCWSFERILRSLWRHCNVSLMVLRLGDHSISLFAYIYLLWEFSRRLIKNRAAYLGCLLGLPIWSVIGWHPHVPKATSGKSARLSLLQWKFKIYISLSLIAVTNLVVDPAPKEYTMPCTERVDILKRRQFANKIFDFVFFLMKSKPALAQIMAWCLTDICGPFY